MRKIILTFLLLLPIFVMNIEAKTFKENDVIEEKKDEKVQGWSIEDGKTYYVDEIGHRVIGIKKINNEYYYFENDGSLCCTQKWKYIDNQWYLVKANGMLKIGWYHNEEGWHYFNSEGQMLTGWQEIDGNTYLFTDKGVITTGWRNQNGWRYFNEQGHMYLGWKYVSGEKYYFNYRGYITIGINEIGNELYYFNEQGHLNKQEKWRKINGEWYFIKSDGRLKIGWYHNEEGWHYFNSEGQMLTGWQEINGNTYLFTDKGIITTGWRNQNGWRYFNEQGHMMIGNVYINGENYYFYEDGHMAKNEWVIKDKKSLYYDENGILIKNKKIIIQGIEYNFDENGYITSWVFGKDGEVYYYNQGVKLTGWQSLGGQKYYFNSLGQRIGNGNVKKVIDISEFDGIIDWIKVVEQGDIDHVIVRIGFGDVREDYQLQRNIQKLKQYKIPFSLYLYSYAENNDEAIAEANFVVKILDKYNIDRNTKIYYDIEKPTYLDGRDIKIKPSQYKKIIPTFMNILNKHGFKNCAVYTYTSYLYNKDSGFGGDSDLIKLVEWIAQYNSDHVYYAGKDLKETDFKGWQYSEYEYIPGFLNNVDVSIFFN